MVSPRTTNCSASLPKMDDSPGVSHFPAVPHRRRRVVARPSIGPSPLRSLEQFLLANPRPVVLPANPLPAGLLVARAAPADVAAWVVAWVAVPVTDPLSM